ncbi:MAG: serine/threonine-protein kinase [Candidatus Acidiferrales bacterium]
MDEVFIGHYQLLEELGSGGMGTVYKAMDTSLDRFVAIKVLAEELSANRELMERFRIEAKAQARLSHTNIATLHAFERFGDRQLIVMEYLDGESFEQMIMRRGPIPSDEAVPLFRQALMGIGYAHRMGIIHRDIKPSNIMVTKSGIVKVMDFGIAKVIGDKSMTRTGTRMGTMAYMSPEQILNQPVDIRSDIYSLGVTLFQLLTAHLPFEDQSDYQLMTAHVSTPPPLPTRHYPYIPAGIERATLEALAKKPDERFQTCEAFGAALEHPGEIAVIGVTSQSAPPPPYAPAPTPPPPPMQTSAPAQGGWLDQIKDQTAARNATAPQPAPGTFAGAPAGSGVPPTQPPPPSQQAWPTPPPAQPWQPQPQAPVPPVYVQPEKKRRSPWLYVALGVVGGIFLLVAILIGIGFMYQRAHSTVDNNTTTTTSDSNSSSNVYSNPTAGTTSTGPAYVEKQVLTPQAGEVWNTALSPDGNTLATGDNDNTLKLWNLATNNVQTMSRQNGPIFGVAFTPDGQQVASASGDKSLFTWNTSDASPVMSFPGDFPLWTVAYSPDGTMIAAAGSGQAISLWAIPSGKFIATIQTPAPDISEIRFSPDGRLLAEGGNDGEVYLWTVADQSQFADLKSHTGAIHSVAFSADGTHLATADNKGVIYLWNVGGGSPAPIKMLVASDQQAINDLAFTPDGNYLISASDDKNIGVWNASSGELLNTLTGHTDAVVSLSMSHDGKLLVSSSKDGTVRLWQIAGAQ